VIVWCTTLLPAVPFMSKFYLLLAFDALLFGTIAMSLDLLMGYRARLVRSRRVLRTRRLRERGPARAGDRVAVGVPSLRGLVVGLYALVVSFFATARRGIYFALLTLIFAEVVYTFFRYTQTFGGSDGIQGVAAPRLIGDFAIDTPLRNYYLVLVYLGLAYLACRVLVTSHFGRVLVAIRENEDRARFLGYNVQRYKMAICMISALLTGLGGALYPGRSAFATPDLMLWTVSGEFIIMVMIGGLGTLAGPVVGGAFFVLLQEKVSSYVDWYFIVIGLVLIFIVLFMPKGLLGIRELLGGRRWRTTA
jgi:branched-chain amino acid transport system permease protein